MNDEVRERIGILGGTFNPVHIGHLLLARGAAEAFALSRVVLVPSADPPHKPAAGLAPAGDRLAMARLAVADDPLLEVSEIELRRRGPSFTVDTMAELCAAQPATAFFFVIGSDTLRELHSWKDIRRLLTLCSFAVLRRPGAAGPETLRPDDLALPPPWPERLLANVRTGRMVEVSSSEIRRRVAGGLGIRYLVPRAVEEYIRTHGLYAGAA